MNLIIFFELFSRRCCNWVQSSAVFVVVTPKVIQSTADLEHEITFLAVRKGECARQTFHYLKASESRESFNEKSNVFQ
jgi:hypothetical protein